jgi:glycosyltransferase involved in cell wall biosynthesis
MPEKVYVVLNGVDTLAFNPSINGAKIREEFAIQPDEIVVGIASRFNLQKGHETFLEAAAIILSCQPNLRNKIRFLIAGGAVFQSDKKREQYLLSVAEKMGISDRVIFTGFRKDMPQVYAAMDMFVLASDAEACGRVILEAMASGKAVIATNSGGTPEIVKDKETGFLIEPRNPKDLADKIAFLVNNIAVARKTGEAGRKIVEENFSIEKNVREIEKIYLELIFR